VPDGIDQMLAKVRGRGARSPKVPITPSLHPKGETPASAVVPVPPSPRGDTTPSPQRIRPTQSPRVNSGPAYAARRGKVQLRSDQESWLHGLIADALREGIRVSEGDVLRVAVDRLRTGQASWPELKEAILAETRGRSRRR
jgi:hypothetical protein